MKFDFEKLDVWNISVDFAEKIYRLTEGFPKNEMYGLISQIRRSSTSISLNIAEGKGRSSRKEFKQFLFIARGSLYETITLLRISLKMGYVSGKMHDELITECGKIQSKLSGLTNYLNDVDCK